MVPLLVGSLLCLLRAAARAGLPDGRAYEQVSPVDKNGADIGSTGGTPFAGVAVSADGNGAALLLGDAVRRHAERPRHQPLPLHARHERLVHQLGHVPPAASPGALDLEYAHVFNADLTRGSRPGRRQLPVRV